MKVGLFITNQQTLDTDMVSALDDQFAMVRLARDCGWELALLRPALPQRGQQQAAADGATPGAARC